MKEYAHFSVSSPRRGALQPCVAPRAPVHGVHHPESAYYPFPSLPLHAQLTIGPLYGFTTLLPAPASYPSRRILAVIRLHFIEICELRLRPALPPVRTAPHARRLKHPLRTPLRGTAPPRQAAPPQGVTPRNGKAQGCDVILLRSIIVQQTASCRYVDTPSARCFYCKISDSNG